MKIEAFDWQVAVKGKVNSVGKRKVCSVVIAPYLILFPQMGLTALMYAILEKKYCNIRRESREKIIRLLIDGKADVNAQNQVLV